jgi:DNA-binding GntR family transcriptional regulator
VVSEHAEILDAVETGDGARAAALTREHLGRLRSTYEEIDLLAGP